MCSCYANGIGCQVDKPRYPCHCTVKNCKNPFGLKRFNQQAVFKHLQTTLNKFRNGTLTTENNNTINNNEENTTTDTTKTKAKRKRKRTSFTNTKKKRKI